jgi:hypothetical protein
MAIGAPTGGRTLTDRIFGRNRPADDTKGKTVMLLGKSIELQKREHDTVKKFIKQEKREMIHLEHFEAFLEQLLEAERKVVETLAAPGSGEFKKYIDTLDLLKRRFDVLIEHFEPLQKKFADTQGSFTSRLLLLDRRISKVLRDATAAAQRAAYVRS